MITTKALPKFSRRCSFLHHRNLVPVKPILDGATTNDMAPSNSFLKVIQERQSLGVDKQEECLKGVS
ncbi:hypothetical protein NC651_015081 [Populus alba x Populus x berolinensis]|nr:hypothetical protein NC651_015081 [Populus alba x Populus x berolinensis]